MQEIINRIELIKNKLNYKSAGRFADDLGISRSNFSQMMQGKRPIGEGIVNKICIHMNIEKEWLMTGIGNMLGNNNSENYLKKMIQLLEEKIDSLEKDVKFQGEKNKALIEELERKDKELNDRENEVNSLKKSIKNLSKGSSGKMNLLKRDSPEEKPKEFGDGKIGPAGELG